MKYNIFNRKPNVEILKSINVSDIEWCDEAVLIRVKNGKGTLAHRISEECWQPDMELKIYIVEN